MYVYVCIYIYICIFIHVYTHIHTHTLHICIMFCTCYVTFVSGYARRCFARLARRHLTRRSSCLPPSQRSAKS